MTTTTIHLSVANANAVLAWMNAGKTSVATGVILFLVLLIHWTCQVTKKLTEGKTGLDEATKNQITIQRKIWIILYPLAWGAMNTDTFCAVWGWFTGLAWIVLHMSLFLAKDKMEKFFGYIMAACLAMSVILWFGLVIVKGIQRTEF